ncbi:DUF2188 domain-containing protein [Paenibacillus sp. GbtcB18]|uniref:DUF2188 domain-containing protein n=1 Tax=Paenibacillus TaxID=44249 RepID=UPI001C2F91E0|nr:DUF2188 domain-containing protein [Paenibacillus sp. GbtcB18]
MPWTKNDYPPSMKNLPERVRKKAVEIANALLDDGYEEGRAIAIATAKAEEWEDNHPDHRSGGKSGTERRASSSHSSPLHVVPDGDGWAVKAEGEDEPRYEADTKSDAVKKADELASDANTRAVIHRKDGTVQDSHNYS